MAWACAESQNHGSKANSGSACADSIFATGEELLSTLLQSGAARQALRVGLLATLSRNFQMEFLGPLLGRTDIDLILRYGGAGELLRALEALSLDVVLLNQAPAGDALSRFVTHRLAESVVSLVGTPDRLRSTAGLADRLREHPIILPTLESSLRMGFDALVDGLGVRPQIIAEVEDMAMMRLLVREGIGLAVLPPVVVKDEIAAGVLIADEPIPGIVETFHAVTIARRVPNPLVRLLLKQAKEEND